MPKLSEADVWRAVAEEGVRSDGSNIDTQHAHAALEETK